MKISVSSVSAKWRRRNHRRHPAGGSNNGGNSSFNETAKSVINISINGEKISAMK
jgi:hypothetical protein